MKIGKLPENILRLSVLRPLHSKKQMVKGAAVGSDCAVFPPFGKRMLSESTAEGLVRTEAEACSAYHADNKVFRFTMRQLIVKCVNNLATQGAKPLSVDITLLLPADVENEYIFTLMSEADDICSQLSMQVSGGQSRILGEITAPIAVVHGLGLLEAEARSESKAESQKDEGEDSYPAHRNIKPSQDIVLSKWAGLQGTAVLAEWYREELDARYPAYLAETAMGFDRYLSVSEEAVIAWNCGVRAMHDASEGGILGALWELVEGAGLGLDIDIRKIPLRQETVEVCECCGVNPYELMSGGCMVMAADDGEGLIRKLQEKGIPAANIGKVTSGKTRIIRNGEEVRYMDRPKQDELFRIVEGFVQENYKSYFVAVPDFIKGENIL